MKSYITQKRCIASSIEMALKCTFLKLEEETLSKFSIGFPKFDRLSLTIVAESAYMPLFHDRSGWKIFQT